jgi:hypothetical protein
MLPPRVRVVIDTGGARAARPSFLFFNLFCERFSQVNPFWKDFKKWTPELGAVDHGAKLTCLGATYHGAEVLGLKIISVTLL